MKACQASLSCGHATAVEPKQGALVNPAKASLPVRAASPPALSLPIDLATCTIASVVDRANQQLQANPHISAEQVQVLQDIVGDVQTLLDLDNHGLNDVLCNDSKLKGMQVVTVRRLLRHLRLGMSSSVL